jgi:hypothetical protein
LHQLVALPVFIGYALLGAVFFAGSDFFEVKQRIARVEKARFNATFVS